MLYNFVAPCSYIIHSKLVSSVYDENRRRNNSSKTQINTKLKTHYFQSAVMTTPSLRALILYRCRQFINHYFTYLLTYLLIDNGWGHVVNKTALLTFGHSTAKIQNAKIIVEKAWQLSQQFLYVSLSVSTQWHASAWPLSIFFSTISLQLHSL